jgi:pyridoxal phosphate enzyme (YggS family)
VAIRDNLLRVEERIAAACKRAGRNRFDVTLVAVSKTFPASAVEEAIAAGATDVGENRVQEARDKKPEVRGSARWHLIGHLQSNKAKDAARIFDVVQTIDSASLAQKISNAATAPIDALIEVNIGGEPQKAGVMPADVAALASEVAALPNLRITGLMTIPPIGTPDESRKYFQELRALCDRLGLKELSMGMSEDFEVAIEEGATIVRVGRAIFGERH